MKNVLFILFLVPLVFSCSDDDNISTLMITNNINEDFTLTKLSFYAYEFSNLNLQYGESQMESFLVLGMTLNAAKDLGKKFKQNAIVWSDQSTISQLILLR